MNAFGGVMNPGFNRIVYREPTFKMSVLGIGLQGFDFCPAEPGHCVGLWANREGIKEAAAGPQMLGDCIYCKKLEKLGLIFVPSSLRRDPISP